MRILLLTGWLLLPVLAAAYHYGPGQERLRRDHAAAVLADADRAAAAKQWSQAEGLYAEALGLVPPDQVADVRRIRLERDKAQILNKKLPTAHDDLGDLVQEMVADSSADAKVLAEARSTLANAQYYMTWLMRLEGDPRDEWEREVEAARQNYRLLAEQAEARGDSAEVKKQEEDLESAVRLARMDLSELQGLPLPSQ